MKGISKRVTVGFMSIVALLFVSGMISLFELRTLSNDTESILAASRSDMSYAKDMLRYAHDHNHAMMRCALFGEEAAAKECRQAVDAMEVATAAVRRDIPRGVEECLDTLSLYIAELRALSEERLNSKPAFVKRAHPNLLPTLESDSVQVDAAPQPSAEQLSASIWYEQDYEVAYRRLTDQVERYMTLSHGSLAPRAEQLNKNAYRSITPVFISLLVMIAIVLMLYFFVLVYGVRPIVRINRSLSDYLAFKLPFKVKAELIDELRELSDNIENLVNISKTNKNE